MTETNEIKTSGINLLVTGKENGQSVLLVGLNSAYRDKPQHQKALQREYDRCHELEHPHIMKYLALKEVEPYGNSLLMEWEPARNLGAYLQEEHSVDECKRVLRQIADALGYLHRNGMVHGALDSQCVFVTEKGDEVKLLNFRLRYADKLNQPADSLKFIAPEAKDGTIGLDARADTVSLGAIARAVSLGPEYDDVIKSCCSYGRSERFADTETFIDALEHRRAARSSRSSNSEPKPGASNKKVAVGIAVFVALALVAFVWFFNNGGLNLGTATEGTASVADTTQTAPAATPTDDATQQEAAAATPANTDDAAPAPAQADTAPTDEQYTGELAFLGTLVPQMHIDIDKLYARGGGREAIHRRVVTYYKGLRGTLKNMSQAQYDAFDKAFGDYIKQKNAE